MPSSGIVTCQVESTSSRNASNSSSARSTSSTSSTAGACCSAASTGRASRNRSSYRLFSASSTVPSAAGAPRARAGAGSGAGSPSRRGPGSRRCPRSTAAGPAAGRAHSASASASAVLPVPGSPSSSSGRSHPQRQEQHRRQLVVGEVAGRAAARRDIGGGVHHGIRVHGGQATTTHVGRTLASPVVDVAPRSRGPRTRPARRRARRGSRALRSPRSVAMSGPVVARRAGPGGRAARRTSPARAPRPTRGQHPGHDVGVDVGQVDQGHEHVARADRPRPARRAGWRPCLGPVVGDRRPSAGRPARSGSASRGGRTQHDDTGSQPPRPSTSTARRSQCRRGRAPAPSGVPIRRPAPAASSRPRARHAVILLGLASPDGDRLHLDQLVGVAERGDPEVACWAHRARRRQRSRPPRRPTRSARSDEAT